MTMGTGSQSGMSTGGAPSTTPSYPMGGTGLSSTSGGAGGTGGYYTGPYNTGPAAAGSANMSSGAYANTTSASPGLPSGAANSGYQSPYAAAPAGSYRTADSRSSFGAGAPLAQPAPYGGNTGAPTWGTDSYRSSSPPNAPVAPAGYGADSNSAPPAWNTANSPYGANTGAATTAGLNTRGSTYRPGSTSRNVGTLSATPSGTMPSTPATNSFPSTTTNPYSTGGASGFPASPYSSPATGGFPTTGQTSPTSTYGGYSYPTTGQ
jgi:hypothetical protein